MPIAVTVSFVVLGFTILAGVIGYLIEKSVARGERAKDH